MLCMCMYISMFVYIKRIRQLFLSKSEWVGDNKCIDKWVMTIKIAKEFYRWTAAYISSYIEMYIYTKEDMIYANHS